MAVTTTSDIQFYSNTFGGSLVNSSDRLIGCVDELVTAEFTVTYDAPITGVRLKWGLIKNSTTLPVSPSMSYPSSYFNHIDFGVSQSWKKNNLPKTLIPTEEPLTISNNLITNREGEQCIASLSLDGLTLTIQHTFFIQGRAKSDYLTDSDIDVSLNSNYTGFESLRYVYSVEHFETANDDIVEGNTDMINIAKTDYFKDGQIGYYNEWKNGDLANYQLISFEYSESENSTTSKVYKPLGSLSSDDVTIVLSSNKSISEFNTSKVYNDSLSYFSLSNSVGGASVQNMSIKSYDVTDLGGNVFEVKVVFREGFYFGDYILTAICGVDVVSDENDKLNTNVFLGVTPLIQRTDNLENIAEAPITFEYHNGSNSHSNIVGYVEDYVLASTNLQLARGVNFGDTVSIQSVNWKVQRNNGDSFTPNYVTVDSILFSGASLNTPFTSFTQERFNKLVDGRRFASASLTSEDAINNLGGFYIEDANTIKRFDGGDFTSIWSNGDVVNIEDSLSNVIRKFTIVTVTAIEIKTIPSTFTLGEIKRAYSDLYFKAFAKSEYFVNDTLEGNLAYKNYSLTFPFMLRFEDAVSFATTDFRLLLDVEFNRIKLTDGFLTTSETDIVRFIVNGDEDASDYDQVNSDSVETVDVKYFDSLGSEVGGILIDENTTVEATFTRPSGLLIDDYGFVMKLDQEATAGEFFLSEFSNFKSNNPSQFISTIGTYEPEKIQVDANTIKCKAIINKESLMFGSSIGYRVSARCLKILTVVQDGKITELGVQKSTELGIDKIID